jgi:hypothetical protein
MLVMHGLRLVCYRASLRAVLPRCCLGVSSLPRAALCRASSQGQSWCAQQAVYWMDAVCRFICLAVRPALSLSVFSVWTVRGVCAPVIVCHAHETASTHNQLLGCCTVV